MTLYPGPLKSTDMWYPRAGRGAHPDPTPLSHYVSSLTAGEKKPVEFPCKDHSVWVPGMGGQIDPWETEGDSSFPIKA